MRNLLVPALLAACLVGCSGGSDRDQATGNGDTSAPASADPAPVAAPVAFASLTGNAAKGETDFLQCKICHSLNDGENRIGPSLHAVVGRKAGQAPGFAYSPAMRDSGTSWSDEALYRFLENPRAMVPGTKMAFAGISNPQTRADIIAYLKTAPQ